MNASREQWRSHWGFVLAAVGSAVGLGNMWRFSYLTAEKGGAAFVALYIVFMLAIGLPVMLAELTIGRGARMGPVAALAYYGGPAWKWLGAMFVTAGFLILAYYGVIGGWTLRYAAEAATVGFGTDHGGHFTDVASGFDSLGTQLVFMAMTIVIVAGGIGAGIERAARIAMPMLFVIVVGIAGYAYFLEGSGEGYRYYLNFDLANVWDLDVAVAAAGHAFFSLSLGMGAILTFASYLPRESKLVRETVTISFVDLAVAFVAGLMVFPLIFALGMQDEIEAGTMGALFVALPKAFAEMGAVGRLLGTGFFVALAVGAITSAISLLEVVVSSAIDSFGWSRRRAAWLAGIAVTACGVLPAFRLDVLDFADSLATNFFLLGGGLGIAIFVGWVMDDPIGEAAIGAEKTPWLDLWRLLLRYVVPAALVFVLWHSLPETWGKLMGLFPG